ncbi:DUF1552 domain-containing protein [Rubinisphaera sp.]|uniref:DUF1552 domain-containing protein n=1 Tax=Rubinisphaera sp. TaxID=2024857 RepID=UPI0025F8DE60|nr:DUF1552 domain-containing protein [Rubinisphaera sp.]|tara:strand:+ start:11322 stop:12635 length:1314 start_codon:yes stop_codon:yes gene_type:complete
MTISRRTMLHGLGVTMALPWLESVSVFGAENRSSNTTAPVRLACLFSGNGFHSEEWWAKGEGEQMQLGKVLESLHPFREKMLFLRGLYNEEARIGGIHSCQTGNLLTGAHLADGGEIRSGISMDQVVAKHYAGQTKVDSLVLGCEHSIAALHKNYSMIYSSHISWSSDTTPTPLELYPALAFDRLFRNEISRTDESVIDAVLDDAKELQRQISKSDTQRLAEYLESVREVERRIDSAGKERRLQGWRPTLTTPNIARPADGIPQDIDEHMRLMCDILILAFRTDTTRVCTLKLNNDHSSLRFPNLVSDRGPTQGIDYMIHHLLSHTNNGDWLKVNQFFVEQLAYIAGKLDSIQEGERTLLDNSMILYLSSMMTGNHNNDQLPVVILGSGGGQMKTGRILDYMGQPNRKMCSLYLSMMDKCGVKLDRFGDSNQRLNEV